MDVPVSTVEPLGIYIFKGVTSGANTILGMDIGSEMMNESSYEIDRQDDTGLEVDPYWNPDSDLEKQMWRSKQYSLVSQS